MVKRDEAWEASHGAAAETHSVSTASTSHSENASAAAAAQHPNHGVPPPSFPSAHGFWPWHGPRGGHRGPHPPGPHGHHPPGPHGHGPHGHHGHHPPGPHGHGPHGHHGHHPPGPHGHGPHGHHGHHPPGPHGHGHHGHHEHHGHGPHGHGPHGHHEHNGPWGHHAHQGHEEHQAHQEHHHGHGPWGRHVPTAEAVEAAQEDYEEGRKGGKAKRQGRLMARFVKATPEEFVVMPGQSIVQTWEVRNESGFSWPSHVELIFVGGDVSLTEGVGIEDPFVQGGLPPGEVRTIAATLKAPPLPGRYEAVFRLRERVPDTKAQDGFRPGQKFGQRLWTAVRVTTNAASGGSSGEDDEGVPAFPAVQRARLTRLRGKADHFRTKLAQVESRIQRIEQKLAMVD